MPKTAFASENKVQTNNEFPRLSLDYQERALILAIEPEPQMEYRHSLRAPELGPDGRVLKEIKQGKKGEYESVVYEFFGQHLCFGDFDVLSDKGVDPDNCPTCKAAVESEGIDPPKPHYAMNVVRYGLQPGGFTLRDPYTVSVEAWVFAPNRFNTLVDLVAEWGDLRQHDLKLGPCENKGYQKYDIQPTKNAQWLLNTEEDERLGVDRKQLTADVYKKNRCEDLTALIARKIDKSKALEDISRVEERVAQAYGRVVSLPTQVKASNASISSEVDDLLGDSKPKNDAVATELASVESVEPAQEAKSPAAMSFDEILGSL